MDDMAKLTQCGSIDSPEESQTTKGYITWEATNTAFICKLKHLAMYNLVVVIQFK